MNVGKKNSNNNNNNKKSSYKMGRGYFFLFCFLLFYIEKIDVSKQKSVDFVVVETFKSHKV